VLTNCPPCILFLEQGLELMRESGEPMECGIFDFYKVFSRAFGEEDGVRGTYNGSQWDDIVTDFGLKTPRHQLGFMRFIESNLFFY
jgi:hypothetical protein